MHVGLFLNDLGPRIGGGFTYQAEILLGMAEAAKDSSHRFTVFFHKGTHFGGLEADLSKKGIPCISLDRMPPNLAGARIRFARMAITARCRRLLGRPAVMPNYFDVMFRELGIECVWFLANRHVEVETPFITTVWDLQHRLQPWFPELCRNGEWHRRESEFGTLLRRATAVVTGTKEGRDEIVRFYGLPEERVLILPMPTPRHALAPPEPRPGTLKDLHLPAPFVFYPAQFWAHKNHVNLLHALAVLRDRKGLKMAAVFAGGDRGNMEHVRKVAAELGLSDRVKILGFVETEALVALYREARALVFPSYFGPDNLPPLEAFALGCPVIAARVPGAEEQLGDAAEFVDPSDPEAMAWAIFKVHSDEAVRGEMVDKGKRRAGKWVAADSARAMMDFLDRFERIRRGWEK